MKCLKEQIRLRCICSLKCFSPEYSLFLKSILMTINLHRIHMSYPNQNSVCTLLLLTTTNKKCTDKCDKTLVTAHLRKYKLMFIWPIMGTTNLSKFPNQSSKHSIHGMIEAMNIYLFLYTLINLGIICVLCPLLDIIPFIIQKLE